MQRSAPVDPTKMGIGRAIAVLTSGGDAQGEEVCICVYRHLWRLTLWMWIQKKSFAEILLIPLNSFEVQL